MRKLLSILSLAALSPLLLVVGLVILCLLPFWIFFYKRSAWYKERGEKYTFGVNSALYYKIYNLAAKCDLPLEYRKEGGYHFFLTDDRLIFPLSDYVEEVAYNEKEGRFEVLILTAESEEEAVTPLSLYLEWLLKELGQAAEGKELSMIISEDALGDHAKEGRDVFLSFADKGDLKRLLKFLSEEGRVEEDGIPQEER